jgi:hypothetical protein
MVDDQAVADGPEICKHSLSSWCHQNTYWEFFWKLIWLSVSIRGSGYASKICLLGSGTYTLLKAQFYETLRPIFRRQTSLPCLSYLGA